MKNVGQVCPLFEKHNTTGAVIVVLQDNEEKVTELFQYLKELNNTIKCKRLIYRK